MALAYEIGNQGIEASMKNHWKAEFLAELLRVQEWWERHSICFTSRKSGSVATSVQMSGHSGWTNDNILCMCGIAHRPFRGLVFSLNVYHPSE